MRPLLQPTAPSQMDPPTSTFNKISLALTNPINSYLEVSVGLLLVQNLKELTFGFDIMSDEDCYEDSFVSEDGRSRGSVRVSKDGHSVSSYSSSTSTGGQSVSVSSSSSVSSSGGVARGKSTVRTNVDGESRWCMTAH